MLGSAICLLSDFINAVRNDEARALVLGELSALAKLTYRFSGMFSGVDEHLLYLYRLYWGYRFYCWLVGQQIKLTRVSFASPRPVNCFDYAHGFGCEILFDQADNSFSFEQSYLVLPIVRSKIALLEGDYPDNFPDWFTVPGHDQSTGRPAPAAAKGPLQEQADQAPPLSPPPAVPP